MRLSGCVEAVLANFIPIVGFPILWVATLAVGIASFNAIRLSPSYPLPLNSIEANVVTPMIPGARIRSALVATTVLIVTAAFA